MRQSVKSDEEGSVCVSSAECEEYISPAEARARGKAYIDAAAEAEIMPRFSDDDVKAILLAFDAFKTDHGELTAFGSARFQEELFKLRKPRSES